MGDTGHIQGWMLVDLLSLEVGKKPAAVFPWGSRLTPVRAIDEMTQEAS